MTQGQDDVHLPVTDAFETLDHALQHQHDATARRITVQLAQSSHLDALLALLARHATSTHAVELLIEALDTSGVVRRFAAAALLDQSAVDDVSQEALISVAGSLDSYDGRGKVTTWVHSIVRHRVVDHLRRQRLTVPLEDHDGPVAARLSSMIATRTTVRDALDELPQLYRMPVVLRDLEGHSYADIAQRLDRAEGTIKAQIARGRAMVAAQLRHTEGAP